MRNPRLLANAVNKAAHEEKEKLVQEWLDSVPDSYRNARVDDCIRDTGTRSGVSVVSSVRHVVRTSGRLDNTIPLEMGATLKDNTGSFIILQGTTGTGKTTMAVAMATEILLNSPQPKRCLYTTSVRAMSGLSWEHMDGVRRLIDPDILVLDDLGVANDGMTQYQQRMFWEVIENRWNTSSKVTFITTNMPIHRGANGEPGLSDVLGPAIWDRMSDRMAFILMNRDSMRGAQINE